MCDSIRFFECYDQLFRRNLTIRELKKVIKDKTGIKENNQRFSIYFDYNIQEFDDEDFYFNLKILVYDITHYKDNIRRELYWDLIVLDLNKRVEELKKMIYEKKQIPIERQQFSLWNKILSGKEILKDKDLFENNLSIKITKELNDLVYIKYPNSEIKLIRTDLYNTGLEFLEQVQNFSAEKSLKYIAFYKNKQIDFGNLLINYGIKGNNKEQNYDNKNIDFIELKIRETFQIFVKDLCGRTLVLEMGPYDTIELLNFYILKNIKKKE